GGGCTAVKGVNRYVWDMRSQPRGGGGGGFGGGGGGFGGGGGQASRVDPGDYTVKIKLGTTEMSKPIKVMEDPRINFSAEDRAKKKAALTKFQPFVTQAQQAQTMIAALRTNVNAQIEAWKRPGAPQPPANVKTAAEDLLKKIDAIYPNWGQIPTAAGANLSSAGPPLVETRPTLGQRANQVLGAIEGTSGAPTDWELAQIEILSKKIPTAAAEVRSLVTVDLPALNALMLEAKIPYIQAPAGAGGGGQRPPTDDNYDEPR
ncbi:MAG: hypothetical protein ABL999_12635, partial [Pyrinomonadaceae bacterium]